MKGEGVKVGGTLGVWELQRYLVWLKAGACSGCCLTMHDRPTDQVTMHDRPTDRPGDYAWPTDRPGDCMTDRPTRWLCMTDRPTRWLCMTDRPTRWWTIRLWANSMERGSVTRSDGPSLLVKQPPCDTLPWNGREDWQGHKSCHVIIMFIIIIIMFIMFSHVRNPVKLAVSRSDFTATSMSRSSQGHYRNHFEKLL